MALGSLVLPITDSFKCNHLGYIEKSLADKNYLLGDFSAADIQLSFVGEIAGILSDIKRTPNIAAWVKRFQSRAAYVAALEKGGKYSYA